MKYVGVDGCKAGWISVSLEQDALSWAVFTCFADLVDHYGDDCILFVDMPVGFPAAGTRKADVLARKLLPGHLKSSIFNTPVRAAVYAADKGEAKRLNEELSGKSLSEQSIGLMKKMIDVDEALQAQPGLQKVVFESHPEICFCQLAGRPLQYRKKDLLGGLERLNILNKFTTDALGLLEAVRSEFPLSKIGGDDVLDACILAVAARQSGGSPDCVPPQTDKEELDETGLAMRVWFPA